MLDRKVKVSWPISQDFLTNKPFPLTFKLREMAYWSRKLDLSVKKLWPFNQATLPMLCKANIILWLRPCLLGFWEGFWAFFNCSGVNSKVFTWGFSFSFFGTVAGRGKRKRCPAKPWEWRIHISSNQNPSLHSRFALLQSQQTHPTEEHKSEELLIQIEQERKSEEHKSEPILGTVAPAFNGDKALGEGIDRELSFKARNCLPLTPRTRTESMVERRRRIAPIWARVRRQRIWGFLGSTTRVDGEGLGFDWAYVVIDYNPNFLVHPVEFWIDYNSSGWRRIFFFDEMWMTKDWSYFRLWKDIIGVESIII